MSIYLPREDSFLIQIAVKDFTKGRVLDMGTGTGIQAITAASNKSVKEVLAVDVNKKAIKYCKRNIKNKKIRFAFSDLFSNVRGKFDTIIFNPPYLPADKYKADISVIGGKRGYETIERFLENAGKYLNENGIILLLFSSLTGKEKIDEIIEKNAFVFEQLQEKNVGLFEKLYVYLIRKNVLLKKLEKIRVTDVKKFAKGHRGVIYKGRYKNKKVAIKTQRADICVKSLHNEINCLKKLQKYDIGPKLIEAKEDFFVYEFIEGSFIEDFVEKEKSSAKIKKVLKNIITQCRTLDELGINKEEMHHPYKHIIVTRNYKPFLVDFERCKKTNEPKNVTQFCQYLISGKISYLLKKKDILIDKIRMIELAKLYKKNHDEKNFKKIVEMLK